MRMRAISFCYHDVRDPGPGLGSDSRTAALYCLGRSDFRGHLESVSRHSNAVTVRTLQRAATWDHVVPLLLTFDDGARSAFECVADELEERGWRGHFFITTNWIGRPGFLERWHLRELRERGHVIGSHSCSHPERMSHLPWRDLIHEWRDSCALLSDLLGEPVTAASLPNGYFSRSVAASAALAGIEVLFTSEPTTAVAVHDGCLVLGRFAIQRNTPPAVSGALVSGRKLPRWRQAGLWKMKKIAKTMAGEHYLALRRILVSNFLR